MFNAVIICCTHGFGDSLVLWASEHVKGLYLGGKTAQQDWLKQNRMASKLPKHSEKLPKRSVYQHRDPFDTAPSAQDTQTVRYGHIGIESWKFFSGCRSQICLSLWSTALIKRVSGKLNSKNIKSFIYFRRLPRWFCPSFSFLASREYPARVNTTKTIMPYIYIARCWNNFYNFLTPNVDLNSIPTINPLLR